MRFTLLAARLALFATLMAAFLALVAIALVRAGMVAFLVGTEIMITSVLLGLIALVLALIWLVAALKHNRGEGKRPGMTALLGALAILYVPLHTVSEGIKAPPVHDVTTDPDDPPAFVALAANGARFDANAMIDYRGEHNTVSYMLHEYYPELTKPLMPIMVNKNPTGKMFWRCFNVAKRMGWRIVDFNEKQGRIEAVADSFWFGRPSDIVVRVRAAGTMGARFDMRAASENGEPDFGRNLALIKTYRTALNS
jgi:Protein of unknown function (DUF1499)